MGKAIFFGVVLFCTRITIKSLCKREGQQRKGFLQGFPQVSTASVGGFADMPRPNVFNTIIVACLPEEEVKLLRVCLFGKTVHLILLHLLSSCI